MIKPNGDTIHGGCNICGKQDLVASFITLQFNYGSANDGEEPTFAVCSKCADNLYNYVLERMGIYK